jgi:DNA-binding NarL/FixJ family response regulator
MRVFIVEDSAALRERLSRIISSLQNVEVIGSADNARDSISKIREMKPDTVILDIRLNSSTGYDVLRSVKPQAQSPFVIVLTNYPFLPYRRKYIEAGADYFFDKSTELDHLVQTLRHLAKIARPPVSIFSQPMPFNTRNA